MLNARKILLMSLLACLGAVSLTVSAAAEEPATVTVRIEGSSQTLLPATSVTTTGVPVKKDGIHSCDGYDGIGALDLATEGNWNGQWSSSQNGYTVETLLGESHPFSSSPYWGIWFDDAYAKQGVCAQPLRTGDTLLFAPAETPAPTPLGVEAPSTATTGTPVPVSVVSFANSNGAASPAAAATVDYEGRTATTDAAGKATLQFAQAGTQLVKVEKENSIRTEATVCVIAPGGTGCTAPSGKAPGTPTGNGEVAGFTTGTAGTNAATLVAALTSPKNGRAYRHGHGPRLIAGRIAPAGSVRSVSLALRRVYRHRCFAYEAARGRFMRARCGTAKPFRVSQEAAFSYLLPSRLGPGRYVLTLQAGDSTSAKLTLAHGTSRVAFDVR